ncbi:hypothetical protein N7508_000011 [Penicillium antarcticum]|uniref:uncharacterized protein n=1 Tax=Penicillium antarcticum TaxID=416450 RepID=UPI00238F6FCE|nr:uncharacterized protein N7508_000011 [Penicillium antarcticum]KAJ5319728.1 hypothetical protein N7508_000011 [Penicillium antarcticum]
MFRHETNLEPRGQTQLSGGSNTIETIRNDIADVFGRLAIVKIEIQNVTRQGSKRATESQKTGRFLRR